MVKKTDNFDDPTACRSPRKLTLTTFSRSISADRGVLFEIATENPGFTVNEPLAELGNHRKLPKQYAAFKERIEKALPILRVN
ncbi:hypothetical protein GCM10028808_09160 [Spirosoma migulaei]